LTLAKKLSGGNQQKVVVARELSRDLSLLIASQPTRGVDVGSIEFIHARIMATRNAGKPVVIVSTELDEVTALADRIAVMYRGRIVGIVDAATPRETLGRMMAGATI
jgi:simple sugar transport system ATP-binding protein